LFLVPALAGAAEYAVLTTGFQILAERHEIAGENIRLFTDTGVIELPASTVAMFEPVAEPLAAPKPEAVSTPPVASAPPAAPASPRQLVDQAAQKYGLPAELVHSVARAESAYRPDAISPKGAIGVMQLMPATAARLGADPADPAQNIDAGTRHLRDLLIQYEGSTHKALAAYNAGEGAVQRYQGIPPYSETRGYVEKVLRNYQKLSNANAAKP
jgi:soluble lytic murein transglycosylase-like protein